MPRRDGGAGLRVASRPCNVTSESGSGARASPEALRSAIEALPADLAWDALRAEAATARGRFRTEDPHRLTIVAERDGVAWSRLVERARSLLAGPAPDSVASSPEGLLAPGAEAQIRDKLADGGYLEKSDKDASLESGLRKFQKARDLPQTGIPNHETIQALGLDPNRIFKHMDVGK